MRIFLDSNVLFSGVYSGAGNPRRLLDMAASGRFAAVLSRTVIDEVVRNLRNKAPRALPRLDQVFSEVPFQVALELPPEETIRGWGEFGSDAPIVAAAMNAQVEYLCTGDRRLRERARRVSGLRVVTPADLIAIVDEAADA